MGTALGFSEDTLSRLAKGIHGWGCEAIDAERLAEAGLSADDLVVRQLVALTSQIMGFPRHLSQHTGGFVFTRGSLLLLRLVPIENASMADRTVIDWDKDDLEAMGLAKVDVLALGMLTAIRKSLGLIGAPRPSAPDAGHPGRRRCHLRHDLRRRQPP